MMKVFYLHVRKDGTECHFNDEPGSLKTVKVTRDGPYETTVTRNTGRVDDPTNQSFSRSPPGEGWIVDSDGLSGSTRWWRHARKVPAK